MNNVKRLAVYCGSATGTDPAFRRRDARHRELRWPSRGVDLVYGGGRLGLMGLIADSVLELGGKVYGVIPPPLSTSKSRTPACTELFHVANMHERKAKMTDLADAFIALPGGIGTLDELFEAWSWNALGYHAKPFCLLNVGGFWDGHDPVHRPCHDKRLPVGIAAAAAARRDHARRGAAIAGRSRGKRYARHGLVSPGRGSR